MGNLLTKNRNSRSLANTFNSQFDNAEVPLRSSLSEKSQVSSDQMQNNKDLLNLTNENLGISLHFILIKQLILIMFFSTCLSILPAYLNLTGNYYKSNERQSRLDMLSIGNIYGIRMGSSTKPDLEKMKQNYLYYWMSDIFYSSLFLIINIGFFISCKLYLKEKLKHDNKISDFTLEIKGLPKENLNIEALSKHFKVKKEEIILARDFGAVIKLLKQINKTNKSLSALKENKNTNQSRKTAKIIKKLSKVSEKYENKIKSIQGRIPYDQVEINRAYIMLHDSDSFKTWIKEYLHGYFHNLFWFDRPSRRKFLNSIQEPSKNSNSENFPLNEQIEGDYYSITLKPAHEPTDIIWENIAYTRYSRCLRITFSLLLTMMVLFFSFIMIYYVKKYQSRLPSERSCLIYDANDEGYSKSSIERLCYCKGLQGIEMLRNPNKCSVYLEYLSETWIIKFCGSLVILMVNFFMKILIQKMTKFEKPKIKSQIQKRVFLKIFFVNYINTALLAYLINLKIPNISEKLGGEFDDFNRDWFLSVGNYILALMIISLVSPHFKSMFISYSWFILKRRYSKKNQGAKMSKDDQFERSDEKNQNDENILINKNNENDENIEYIENRENNENDKSNKNDQTNKNNYDIAARAAQITNVVFTCFTYSGGLPLLNLICLCFLIIFYYADKFLLYKFYKKPKRHNELMYFAVLKIMPLAIFFHSCFSLYTYGSPAIFYIESVYYDSFHFVFGSDLADRLGKPSGISFLILIVLSLCSILVINLIDCYFDKDIFERNTIINSIYKIYSDKDDAEVFKYNNTVKKKFEEYELRNNSKYGEIMKMYEQIINGEYNQKDNSSSKTDRNPE